MDPFLKAMHKNIKVDALRTLGWMCDKCFNQYDLALTYYERAWAHRNASLIFPQEIETYKRCQHEFRIHLQLLSTRASWADDHAKGLPWLCSQCQCVSSSIMPCSSCERAWYCSSRCEQAHAAAGHVHFRIPLDELLTDVVHSHVLPHLSGGRKKFLLSLRTLSRKWKKHIDYCTHIWRALIPMWVPTHFVSINYSLEHFELSAHVIDVAKRRYLWSLQMGLSEIQKKREAKAKHIKQLEVQLKQLDWQLASHTEKIKQLE